LRAVLPGTSRKATSASSSSFRRTYATKGGQQAQAELGRRSNGGLEVVLAENHAGCRLDSDGIRGSRAGCVQHAKLAYRVSNHQEAQDQLSAVPRRARHADKTVLDDEHRIRRFALSCQIGPAWKHSSMHTPSKRGGQLRRQAGEKTACEGARR